MAVARIKYTGYYLLDVPDDLSDEEAEEYIDKAVEELSPSDYEGKAEFDDWW